MFSSSFSSLSLYAYLSISLSLHVCMCCGLHARTIGTIHWLDSADTVRHSSDALRVRVCRTTRRCGRQPREGRRVACGACQRARAVWKLLFFVALCKVSVIKHHHLPRHDRDRHKKNANEGVFSAGWCRRCSSRQGQRRPTRGRRSSLRLVSTTI